MSGFERTNILYHISYRTVSINLNYGRADVLFLHNNWFVRRTVGKLGCVVVDIFDLYDDDTSTAATRGSATTTTIVGRRDVQTIRPM